MIQEVCTAILWMIVIFVAGAVLGRVGKWVQKGRNKK